MKTNFKKIGQLFLLGILVASCSKNDDGDSPDYVPSASAFAALREEALDTQTFTFNAEDGATTFTTANGVQFTINGNCLTQNGNPITGQVVVEYAELFNPGTMLVTNKPTMGRMPNGDMSLLISGGEFYINATKNGQQLAISCPMQVIIPANLTGGADTGMSLWDGTIDEDGNLEWDEQDRANGENGVFVEGPNYYAYFSSFGWTNVDRFYSDPRPKTTILAEAPTGYNFENSAIYLHYDGEGSSLAKLDTFNPTTNQFSEHYGQIPVGLECHVIFVTEDNSQWRYAIKSVTIAANDVYVFTLAETTVGTEAQLIAAINALP
ncbi:hypothetical protein MH928_02380 [Flavobacterium sp. WW92]|uniref:hypothetical protein n=1 Tax=unclassified Flavobacterium TaxID=196869 RepID=UPI0022244BBD|nr:MULTISPECIES: hypothetical protein [unclassified Flavobacterium]WDO13558.1 hypothetical protein MH928_02380 [Flavobacterium sp. WW92]